MKVSTTSERLNYIMKERGLKQVDILEKAKSFKNIYNIGLGKSTLSQYVNGVQSPDQDRYYLLSLILDVSEPWLMGYDVEMDRVPDEERKYEASLLEMFSPLSNTRKLMVFEFTRNQLEEQNAIIHVDFANNDKTIVTNRRTAAGSALHVEDADARKEVVSSALIPKGADELVGVVGKSMEPLIKDGEEVYMRYQPSVENGEIAIVRIENEGVTCKRVYANNGTITLKSENEEYEDMHFDSGQVTVLGKVLL